jgi:hypothetical protein
VAMDRTQLWGRRLLSGGFVALAVLGVRAAGDPGALLTPAPPAGRAPGCQVRDLAVTYALAHDDAAHGCAVSGAQLSGPPACAGATVSVTFTGAAGDVLGRATGTYDPAAPVLTLDSGATIAADDITDLAVVLFD